VDFPFSMEREEEEKEEEKKKQDRSGTFFYLHFQNKRGKKNERKS